jgi:hypothetical protein
LWQWEGGTRGTAFVYSPSLLNTSGYTYTGLMAHVDWFPTIMQGIVGSHRTNPVGSTPQRKGHELDGFNMLQALQTNGTSPRTEIYYGTTEMYIGLHGPAIRDAQGWKLILNGGGGIGGWNMTPGDSGGFPNKPPPGGVLGVCGNMMDQFEGFCIDHDGLGQIPTNSSAECCQHCLQTRGCWSWVVSHAEEVCYLNRNDIQQGSEIPPHWPRRPGPCTYAAISGQGVNGSKSLSLFNVHTDPAERVNLTERHPDEVVRLHQLLARFESSAVPQCTEVTCGDPQCPKPRVAQDPIHGYYWTPWC